MFPLCILSDLCVSVVNLVRETLTTETQSTLRMHRERPATALGSVEAGITDTISHDRNCAASNLRS